MDSLQMYKSNSNSNLDSEYNQLSANVEMKMCTNKIMYLPLVIILSGRVMSDHHGYDQTYIYPEYGNYIDHNQNNSLDLYQGTKRSR